MGGLISTIRDVKVILRDLKITLKFTAKIVLKVHGIVDDVEHTVQELKTTVSNLSARIPMQNTKQEKLLLETSATYLNEVVQSIETTADSVKTSLANAISVLTSDDLLKNTRDALESLVSHSGRNLSGVMSRWASIPDDIGELVKQDCLSVTEYIHKARLSHTNASNGKGEEQLMHTAVSEKISKLDSKEDIRDAYVSGVSHAEKDDQQLAAKAIPRIVNEENSGNGATKNIIEILRPLSINECIPNASRWQKMQLLALPGHDKVNRNFKLGSQEDKSVVTLNYMAQTKITSGREHFLEKLTEFQMELLSVLLMTLIGQGFSKENNNVPLTAIQIFEDGWKCKSVGQALMVDCMSCD